MGSRMSKLREGALRSLFPKRLKRGKERVPIGVDERLEHKGEDERY